MSSVGQKVAIITGGSKGIGRSVALSLHSRGAKVVINYLQDYNASEETRRLIEDDLSLLIVQADLRNPEDRKKLVDQTIQKFGKIDILVNNAAYLNNMTLTDLTEDEFDKFFDLNVKGLFFLTQEVVPHMGQGSRIINISSSLTGSSIVRPGHCIYVASKGAVEQFTRTLAKELAPRGITTNTVSPGPVETDLFLKLNSEESRKILKEASPFKRFGKPQEISEVVAFLASSESNWINGNNIRVNGGYVV